jgi:hypothetical protein
VAATWQRDNFLIIESTARLIKSNFALLGLMKYANSATTKDGEAETIDWLWLFKANSPAEAHGRHRIRGKGPRV